MKVKLSILLIASLVLVLLLSSLASLTGCTSKTTTPAATTPATVYEFKFLDQYTPQQAAAQQSELLGKLISDATGGRVKFTYYHSESLGKASEFINLLNGGVADVVNVTPGAFPTQFDVESYVNLPMLGINSRAAMGEAEWALYNKGYLNGLNPYKVLAFNSTPPMNFWLKKKATTVDELKGMKIRGGDAQARKFIDFLGAVGTSMLSSDVYMALDRGTLDGVLTADEQTYGVKYWEVLKYGIYQPKTSIGSVFIIMSKVAWSHLPPDLQAAMDKAIETNKTEFLNSVKAQDASYGDLLKAQGMDLYSFSATETAKMVALAAPIKNDWITSHAAKGVPAKDIAALVDTVLAKYK